MIGRRSFLAALGVAAAGLAGRRRHRCRPEFYDVDFTVDGEPGVYRYLSKTRRWTVTYRTRAGGSCWVNVATFRQCVLDARRWGIS